MLKPIIRMSSSGHCSRALSAELLGYEPAPTPSWLETSAEEGKWHEERIRHELSANYVVTDEQKEVRLDFLGFTLLGHIDGTVQRSDPEPTNWQLLEIKSMSHFEFDRWMRGGFAEFPNYAAQITCYMEATGLKQCLYIVKNRNSGYIDRQLLTSTPNSIVSIEYKLQQVVKTVRENRLQEAIFDPQSLECRRCRYKEYCIPEPKELSPLQEAELTSAAALWREGKAKMDDGQSLVDAAREVFEQHTKATNVLKWRHSGLAIQLIHSRRESYEKKELLNLFTIQQLLPALKITEYDQLRITDLEKEGNNG